MYKSFESSGNIPWKTPVKLTRKFWMNLHNFSSSYFQGFSRDSKKISNNAQVILFYPSPTDKLKVSDKLYEANVDCGNINLGDDSHVYRTGSGFLY